MPSNNGFFVAPLNNTSTTPVNEFALVYNYGTSEIRFNTSKTFVIDHPNDKDKYLVHACLEGPEAGVYYRGLGEITNNKYTTITLPHYVEKLAYDFTVQVTTIIDEDLEISIINNNCEKENKIANIFTNIVCSRVKNNKFNVYGTNRKFYWHVYGKRGEINVEPLKSSVNVEGDGPYKWIS